MRGNEEYKEVGKRCKGALYLRRHRVIKKPGRDVNIVIVSSQI